MHRGWNFSYIFSTRSLRRFIQTCEKKHFSIGVFVARIRVCIPCTIACYHSRAIVKIERVSRSSNLSVTIPKGIVARPCDPQQMKIHEIRRRSGSERKSFSMRLSVTVTRSAEELLIILNDVEMNNNKNEITRLFLGLFTFFPGNE